MMRTHIMAPPVAPLPVELGSHFAGYRVLELIGQGGQACVFRVHDEFLKKDFALKVLFRAGGVTPEMLTRGQTEAQFLSSVRHPHIVEVVRAGIERGLLFIVMELLQGRPLHVVQHLAGRLQVEEVLALAAQVADALAFAHEHKALHRDLKPENVFVCRNNTAKVLDFGVAKLADGGGWQTQRDLVVGTMLYMSPEQLLGQPLTPASDVYALGLIMYTALTGRHPCLLETDAPSHEELARLQILRVPPRLEQLAAHVPPDVGELVAHALAKEPSERISSMLAFGRAIRAALDRRISEANRAATPLLVRDLSVCDFDRSGLQAAPSAPSLPTRTDTYHALPAFGSERLPLALHDRTPSPLTSPATPQPSRHRGAVMIAAASAAVVLAGALFLALRAAHSVNETTRAATQPQPSAPAARPLEARPIPQPPSVARAPAEAPLALPAAVTASAQPALRAPRPATVPKPVTPPSTPQASSPKPKPFSGNLPSSGL
jgi:serine/threonine-protein kinase